MWPLVENKDGGLLIYVTTPTNWVVEHDYIVEEHDYMVEENIHMVEDHWYILEGHDYMVEEHCYMLKSMVIGWMSMI